jgi:DNA-binding FrmR family transcriptional regulator
MPKTVKTAPIKTQLKRIRGQVDGLIKMYDNKRSCIDLVRQIAAARNSLARVARDVLTHEAAECTRDKDLDKLDLVLKELFKH